VLVLLVAPTPGLKDAIARSAHEALDADTAIVVRSLSAPASDDEALELERAARADAVAEIVWAPLKVGLHVHLAQDSRWIDRELPFSRAAPPAEEWRTVGFALASMIPGPPRQKEPAALPVVAELAGPERPLADVAPVEADRAREEPPRTRRFVIDLAALGSRP